MQLAIHGGTPACEDAWPQWPQFDEREEAKLLGVLRSGQWWYGAEVAEFEREFAAFQGAEYCVSCTNGTTALEMALRAIGVCRGDEVIVPCYSFIATASAVVTVGAIPVFADICPDTLCISPDSVRSKLTSKTRAIVPVHVAGRIADMKSLNAIATQHGLALLEDAAHAWGGQNNGIGAGLLSTAGTFSFQVSKNLTAGEGGAVVTNDKEVADLCRSFSHCGRTEGGEWYDHDLLGSNLRLTEFQAALLRSQLERLPAQMQVRSRNVSMIDASLRQLDSVVPLAKETSSDRRSHHFYAFRIKSTVTAPPSPALRNRIVAALQAENIPSTAGWYRPLYQNGVFNRAHEGPEHGVKSPLFGMGADYRNVYCPVAEQVCNDTIWIPQHVLLAGEPKIGRLCDGLAKVLTQIDTLVSTE